MGQKDHELFKLFCSVCPIVSWPTLGLDFHLPCVELSAAGLMEVIMFIKEGKCAMGEDEITRPGELWVKGLGLFVQYERLKS